jgi:hypothetical protein
VLRRSQDEAVDALEDGADDVRGGTRVLQQNAIDEALFPELGFVIVQSLRNAVGKSDQDIPAAQFQGFFLLSRTPPTHEASTRLFARVIGLGGADEGRVRA